MKKVLILGCGWVGKEVALCALKKRYHVYGSTTSADKALKLSQIGIKSFVHDFDAEEKCKNNLPAFFDYVLTSVPASTRYSISEIKKRFTQLQEYLEGIVFEKHIFLSSVGVYPNHEAVYKEDYQGPFIEELRLAETLMMAIPNTVVYRLGGLFGQQRIFAKYFVGRVCTTGEELANFVHLDDVVGLILAGFERELKSRVYNIVTPEHPTKREVILASAAKYNYPEPVKWESTKPYRKYVDGMNIVKELDYYYCYRNPIYF